MRLYVALLETVALENAPDIRIVVASGDLRQGIDEHDRSGAVSHDTIRVRIDVTGIDIPARVILHIRHHLDDAPLEIELASVIGTIVLEDETQCEGRRHAANRTSSNVLADQISPQNPESVWRHRIAAGS